MSVHVQTSHSDESMHLLTIYQDLFSSSPDCVFLMNITGDIFDVNQKSVDLLGYSKDDLCSLNITDLITRENLDEQPLKIAKLQKNKTTVLERDLLKKDGAVIQVEIQGKRLHDDFIIAIVRDITSQKTDQSIYRQIEDRYRLVVETSSEGICIVDEQQIFTYVNKRFAEMIGFPEQEIIGKVFSTFLFEEDMPQYWELITLRQKGIAERYERRFRCKDGSTLWVSVSPKPIFDAKGIFRGSFAMFTDITLQKRKENIQKARYGLMEYSESHTLDEFLVHTLDILDEFTGSPFGCFHFLNSEKIGIVKQVWSSTPNGNEGPSLASSNQHPIHQTQYWMDCIRLKKPIILNDFSSVNSSLGIVNRHGSISRSMIIPVLKGNEVEGVLCVGGKLSDYDQYDVDLVTNFVDLVWNIFESKNATEKLHQNSIQYQALINTSLDGFSKCSADGRILEANEAYCKMLGYSKDEICKLSIPDIEAIERPEETATHIHNMTETGHERFETKHKCKDGSVIDVEVNLTFMPEDNLFMAFTREITEQKRVQEELKENQELLSLFVQHSPIYTFIKSVGKDESRVICVSDNYDQMVGISSEEMRGKSMSEIFPPEFAEKITADDWAVVTDGNVIQLDEELNGRFYSTIKFPIEQKGNKILAGYTIDITDSKVAQQKQQDMYDALRVSDEKLKEAQRIARLGQWEMDLTVNHLTWSDMIYEIFEIDKVNFGADFEAFMNVVHPDDRKAVEQAYSDSIRDHQPYDIEHRLLMKDGRVKWVNEICRNEYDCSGVALRSIGIVQDITARKQAELELIERDRLLQESQETAHVGSYIINLETGENRWTKETYRIFDMDDSEPVPSVKAYEELLHPDDVAPLNEMFGESVTTGKQFNLVYRIKRRDGQFRYVHSIGNIERNSSGNVYQMVGTFQDVTETKQAEAELLKRQNLLEVSQSIAHLGSYVFDVLTGQTFWTRETYRIFGLDENLPSPQAKEYLELVYPEDRALEHHFFSDCMNKGIGYDLTYRIIKSGGEIRFVRSIGNPSFDKNGRVTQITGILQDVTDSKKLENSLRESEKRFKALYENIPLGYQSLDPNGNFLDINPAWSKMLGYNQNEVIGKWFGDFLIKEDVELFRQRFPMFKTNGSVKDVEFHLRHKGGHYITVSFNGQIGYDTWGNVERTHCNLIDVTKRREMENNLQASLAEKEVLLREVHHRVKNNLAAILSLMDMERQSTTDSTAENLLTELSNRIKSMSTVHEKLYRSESLSRIDFQDYLKSFISHLRTSFNTGVDFASSVEAAGIELSLDLAVPCGLIVNELVTNSIKYAFPEGKPGNLENKKCKIDISMQKVDDQYILTIRDNGVGLPEGLAWRESKTLGLRLVRMLCEHQLGGKVEMDNATGTQFTIQFSERSRD